MSTKTKIKLSTGNPEWGEPSTSRQLSAAVVTVCPPSVWPQRTPASPSAAAPGASTHPEPSWPEPWPSSGCRTELCHHLRKQALTSNLTFSPHIFNLAHILVLSTGESNLNHKKQKHNIWCFRPGLRAASFCIKRITLVAVQAFFYVTTAFFCPWICKCLKTGSAVKSFHSAIGRAEQSARKRGDVTAQFAPCALRFQSNSHSQVELRWRPTFSARLHRCGLVLLRRNTASLPVPVCSYAASLHCCLVGWHLTSELLVVCVTVKNLFLVAAVSTWP